MATSTGRREQARPGGRLALFIAIYFAVFLVLGLLGRLLGISAPLLVGAAVQLVVTVLIYLSVRRGARDEPEQPGSPASDA